MRRTRPIFLLSRIVIISVSYSSLDFPFGLRKRVSILWVAAFSRITASCLFEITIEILAFILPDLMEDITASRSVPLVEPKTAMFTGFVKTSHHMLREDSLYIKVW